MDALQLQNSRDRYVNNIVHIYSATVGQLSELCQLFTS